MGLVRIRAKYAARFILPAFALAAQSLQSGSGAARLPNSAPWTNLAAGRPVFAQYSATGTFAAGSDGIVLDGSSFFPAMDNAATDNATLSYAWTQVSGPSRGVFSDPGKAATRFAASAPGTYVLQLTATDKLGKSVNRKVKYGAVPVGPDGLI